MKRDIYVIEKEFEFLLKVFHVVFCILLLHGDPTVNHDY